MSCLLSTRLGRGWRVVRAPGGWAGVTETEETPGPAGSETALLGVSLQAAAPQSWLQDPDEKEPRGGVGGLVLL